MAMVTVRFWVR